MKSCRKRYKCGIFILAMLITAPFTVLMADDPAEAPEPPSLQLEMDLTDGTRLRGTTDMETLPIRTAYARMEIPLNLISTVTFNLEEEHVVLGFRNGDRLTGFPALETINVKTLIGVIDVGIEHIRRIDIRAAHGVGLTPEMERSLVLYYTFDADEGDRVTDRSGHGNHGTVHGAQFTPRGKVGGAMEFDGIKSYIDAGNAPSLQLQSNFTIAAWICAEPSNEAMGIVTRSRGVPEQSRRALELALDTKGVLGAYFWNARAQYMSGGVRKPLVPHRRWTHVSLQHDSSRPRQMRIFINGSEQTVSFNYETVASVPEIRNLSENLRIGCFRPGFHVFHGLLDELMIFDHVLTSDEIAMIAL